MKMEKLIKTEKNTHDKVSMKRFSDHLNIYDKMNKNLNCCPQDNYEVYASLVKFAKEKHMKSKWMTDALLKSIHIKKNYIYFF